MKKVHVNQVKDELSRYLHEAEKEEIVITRHGKAAGVLIGFASENEWFEYRLENARRSIASGKGIVLGDLKGSRPRRKK
jgi:prevent-host-death family protein